MNITILGQSTVQCTDFKYKSRLFSYRQTFVGEMYISHADEIIEFCGTDTRKIVGKFKTELLAKLSSVTHC